MGIFICISTVYIRLHVSDVEELYVKKIAKVFGSMLLYIFVFIYTSCKNSLSSVHSIYPNIDFLYDLSGHYNTMKRFTYPQFWLLFSLNHQ